MGFYNEPPEYLCTPGLRYPPKDCLYTPLQGFTGGYLHTPPPPTRLTRRASIHSREKQGDNRRTRRRGPDTHAPGCRHHHACRYCRYCCSATSVSTLTVRPAADPTIGAADSTATQTRVAIWIQLEQGNRTWLRQQETLAVFYQADTARLEGQIAQTEREALQPSLQPSSFNGAPQYLLPRPLLQYQPVPAHQLVSQSSLRRSPPQVPACNGRTNGYRNLYCAAPPQFHPVPALSTGTAISIAPPPSRNQPVPVPPTGTAIFIELPPLRTSLYRPHQRAPQYLLTRPPLSVSLYPSFQRVRRLLLRRPHPQYRPAATSPMAAQTRLPASSGPNTPTARVPGVVHHNNSPHPPPLTDLLTQPSPFQAPQPSLPPLRTTPACASDLPKRWQHKLALTGHLPHQLTCRW